MKPIKTELVFNIDGLTEQQLAAYCEGIVDALDKLGVSWLYDETDPAAQVYRVALGEDSAWHSLPFGENR